MPLSLPTSRQQIEKLQSERKRIAVERARRAPSLAAANNEGDRGVDERNVVERRREGRGRKDLRTKPSSTSTLNSAASTRTKLCTTCDCVFVRVVKESDSRQIALLSERRVYSDGQ